MVLQQCKVCGMSDFSSKSHNGQLHVYSNTQWQTVLNTGLALLA